MRRIDRYTIFMAMVIILAAPYVEAAEDLDLSPLTGTWNNTDPNPGGIARIIISGEGGVAQVQIFVACDSHLCDWGVVTAAVYGRNATSKRAVTFMTVYDSDSAEIVMTGRRIGDSLRVDLIVKYMEGSERPDNTLTEVFVRK